MAQADFDVVTGPSMPQRRVRLPQQPSGSSDQARRPEALRPMPADGPADPEERRGLDHSDTGDPKIEAR
jgi:hypothetical protein